MAVKHQEDLKNFEIHVLNNDVKKEWSGEEALTIRSSRKSESLMIAQAWPKSWMTNRCKQDLYRQKALH